MSSDFSGDSHSCILDADSSLQLKPNFYKIICWYENEYSYACRVLDSIFFSERQFNTPVRLACKMTYVRARISKKQDELQQTERTAKDRSIECNTEVPKNSSSALETMCKKPSVSLKPPVRPVVVRKPLCSHSSGDPLTAPAVNRDVKKRNELFKIWNDNNDAQKNAARQQRSTFFHSCMAFGPKQSENTDGMKPQERLENVKKEFSKMVNITEDLLKKSNVSKIPLGNAPKSLEGVKLGGTGGSKDSKTIITGNNSLTNNSLCGICGDYKTRLSCSPTNCSYEAERSSTSSDRNENNSENKITSAVRKISVNKPYLIPSRETIASLAKQNSMKTFGLKVENNLPAKAQGSLKANSKNTTLSFRAQMTRNDNYFMDSLSSKSPVQCVAKEPKRTFKNTHATAKQFVEEKQKEVKITEGSSRSPYVPTESNASNSQKGAKSEQIPQKEFEDYLHKKDYNLRIIDEALQKRNIVLVTNEKPSKPEENCQSSDVSSELLDTEIRGKKLNKQILEALNRRVPGPVVIVPVEASVCGNSEGTHTTISNGNGTRVKLDLYDKLDSASATDSTNSFEINERKSQIIQICDLTNSIEDLTRLDKICRIIEISDELSDKLFSSLDQTELTGLQQKTWSFRDLCERIQLDDFCNKVFGKSRS